MVLIPFLVLQAIYTHTLRSHYPIEQVVCGLFVRVRELLKDERDGIHHHDSLIDR